MAEKYKNKYRIKSTRLQSWDYGCDGAYFITICTANRKHFFGNITDGKMNLSEIGKIAEKYWYEIPGHFPFVKLDSFVIMPNHLHGILNNDHNIGIVETRHALSLRQKPQKNTQKTIGQQRFQNQGKNTISSIVGSYKSVVTKYACRLDLDFAWQTRFYDHIIRNEISFSKIRDYIMNNVKNWQNDNLNKPPKMDYR